MKVAINGFGRIGRAAAKIVLGNAVMDLVAINDLGELPILAHLLKYDSCYGIYDKEVGYQDNELIVNTKRVNFYSEKDPADLPWGELDVDVVIESTGVFLTKDKAKLHLDAGAKKVVLSAPPKDDKVPIYVIGSNESKYDGENIISNASCTTNCIAPIMKVLDDVFGIEKSMMTTVHSYTADQNLVDGPHKDLRRARASAINIVPTTTGAAIATGKTIKSLEGRFDGLSVRVPTPVVSLSDITALIGKKVDIEVVNKVLIDAAQSSHQGIIVTSEEPLVSTDLIANTASAVVDLELTNVVAGDLVKVVAWYDNEWGYSNRLVELAELIATKR
jgi:glyceraldehyde 3-phosphate dehydrogenase